MSLNSIPFQFEDKDYEVKIFERIYNGEKEYIVRSFLNGVPADGYSYSIKADLMGPFEEIKGKPAIAYLVELAEKAIRERTWEKLIKLNDRNK